MEQKFQKIVLMFSFGSIFRSHFIAEKQIRNDEFCLVLFKGKYQSIEYSKYSDYLKNQFHPQNKLLTKSPSKL